MDAAPPQLQTFCGFTEDQTEANLFNKGLGPGDAVLLAWELTTGYVSASLTILSLRDNRIGSEGAVAVAKSLEVNASLTSIDLSRNNLRKDGAIAVANALHVNASITKLNLCDNEIGKDGAVALAKALEVNASLTSLK